MRPLLLSVCALRSQHFLSLSLYFQQSLSSTTNRCWQQGGGLCGTQRQDATIAPRIAVAAETVTAALTLALAVAWLQTSIMYTCVAELLVDAFIHQSCLKIAHNPKPSPQHVFHVLVLPVCVVLLQSPARVGGCRPVLCRARG